MKKLLLLTAFIGAIAVTNAQTGFFGPLPKLHEKEKINLNPVVTSTDSTFFGFRPVASILAYSLPNQTLQAGVGLSLQRLDYKFATQTYYVNYSLSLVGFAGGSLAPSTPSGVVSVGLLAGVLNNMIQVGPAYNFAPSVTAHKWQIMVSIGINFNNG